MTLRTILVLFALTTGAVALPQGLPLDADLPVPGVRYRTEVPTPEAVLGVRVGRRHLRSHEVNDYFREVASKSDRVRIVSQGRSWEGRELIHAIVGSPAQLGRLDAIRRANRRIFENSEHVTDADLAQMPIVVWMGYGVHGNEASTCEAAVLTLYHLAAGSGKPVEDVLNQAIVVIAPNYNPDGRDRFVNWANQNRGLQPSADPQDRERQEPWPGGRVNHYGFDLNRDWLPLVHPESQARHAHWTAWRPQITLDYHEMGSSSTYYFPPGVPKRTNPLTPDENQRLHVLLAEQFGPALEAVGESYFTAERFDDFYPGKGSTYPDLIGSVGILFEQAGSRSLRIRTERRTLTFPVTVRNQVATGLAALRAAVQHRERFLRHQRDVFREGLTRSAAFAAVAWPDSEAGRALVRTLLRHEVQVFRSGGRFVVPTRQPLSRLVETAFARVTQFEDNRFYDVSAWNLDLALGLEATPLSSVPDALTPVRQVSEPVWEAPTLDARTLGIVLEGQSMGFFGTLDDVLAADLKVFVLRRTLSEQGRAGSVFVPLTQENQDRAEVAKIVLDAAKAHRTPAYSVPGQTPRFTSWGGENAILLSRPRVALIVGSGADVNATGEIWHLMDAEWGMEITLLDADRLATANLREVSVVVLAGGSYPAAAAEALKGFMSQGGRVIGIGSALDWLSAAQIWSLTPVRHTPQLSGLPYADLAAERGRHSIPGTILWADLDTTHPLALGVPSRLPLFKDGGTLWRTPEIAGTSVARYAANPLASGYLSDEVKALVPGTAAILARREGRGELILISDSPHFRAFHRAGNRVFGNALFWGLAY